MLGRVGRFAGNIFRLPGVKGELGPMMTQSQILQRLSGDLLFGGIEATMTPGDMGDKAIAGLGSALGGGFGGLALSKLAGRNNNLGFMLDMAGSIGGDMAGRMGAEQIQRGKDKLSGGKGQTPYEKLGEKDREALEQMIREDQTGRLLAELRLLPGSTQGYLYDNQGLS
jgi:hypothetical protein